MAPDGQERPQRLPARRRAARPADVTRINQGGPFGQLGPDACEGGGPCTCGRVPLRNSGPGDGAVPPVPGLLGGGARGTVREDLGPCSWRGSPGGQVPGVGAHVRPDGAAKAAQIRVGHNDKVGQAGSESGERRPLDQRSLPVPDPETAQPDLMPSPIDWSSRQYGPDHRRTAQYTALCAAYCTGIWCTLASCRSV
jgi:hypothetical protein